MKEKWDSPEPPKLSAFKPPPGFEGLTNLNVKLGYCREITIL